MPGVWHCHRSASCLQGMRRDQASKVLSGSFRPPTAIGKTPSYIPIDDWVRVALGITLRSSDVARNTFSSKSDQPEEKPRPRQRFHAR